MPVLLQVNVTSNWGSHGKIAEDIGRLAMSQGWHSIIAYGRHANPSKNETIHIGSSLSVKKHALESRFLDNHGLSSASATSDFIKQFECIKPDIIHLHNIHGYYLNYKLLFDYLATQNIPIVWTLHDCWPFTGHCAYFDFAGCERWKEGCCAPCPCKRDYPKSVFLDATAKNYALKKKEFNSLNNLTLVPVSNWLRGLLDESFLKNYPSRVIHNGIDLHVFKPVDLSDVRRKFGIGDSRFILGVASDWEKRKGLNDFFQLACEKIPGYKIVLVGLNNKQLSEAAHNGIIGIPRTENVEQLAALYSEAEIFLNLTYEDNYPTTNLEAMACGTPVLTYNTGGSPESVSKDTGWIVEKGDISKVLEIVCTLGKKDKFQIHKCRSHAEKLFDKNQCFKEYLVLYNELLGL